MLKIVPDPPLPTPLKYLYGLIHMPVLAQEQNGRITRCLKRLSRHCRRTVRRQSGALITARSTSIYGRTGSALMNARYRFRMEGGSHHGR